MCSTKEIKTLCKDFNDKMGCIMINTDEKQIILYQKGNSNINIGVFFHNETFWLTQKTVGELFNVDRSVIAKHIKNIFETGELSEDSTCAKFAQVQQEGTRSVSREVLFYSLDIIIAVGYRVNSYEATQFRLWATSTLKDYIIKGFVLNDDMLKNGQPFGKDYFDELLERIREIRSSERRFYQKITDIYAQCSIDYDPNAQITRTFYKTVQNKLHWAITGNTAAELIASRSNSTKTSMGLTIWKNAPDGKILKADVSVAKNYLDEQEIKELNHVVSMYLDYAENQASRHNIMKMEDWVKKLDAFLLFNEYNILTNAGKITHECAKIKAEQEYAIFRIQQDKDYNSDFDEAIKKIKK